MSWRKSSRCESHACVEIALGEKTVSIRNSQEPQTIISFSTVAFAGLLTELQQRNPAFTGEGQA